MALTSLLRKKTTTPASAAPPRAVDGEILLEATGVTKSYAGADRELPVLAGIDLQVEPARSSPCWASPARASPPCCAASRA